MGRAVGDGLKSYYKAKIEELELLARDKQHNLRRLEAQRNELNTKGALCLHTSFPCSMSKTPGRAPRMNNLLYLIQCGYSERSYSCFRSRAPMSERSSR